MEFLAALDIFDGDMGNFLEVVLAIRPFELTLLDSALVALQSFLVGTALCFSVSAALYLGVKTLLGVKTNDVYRCSLHIPANLISSRKHSQRPCETRCVENLPRKTRHFLVLVR